MMTIENVEIYNGSRRYALIYRKKLLGYFKYMRTLTKYAEMYIAKRNARKWK
jgi:hypothetical protein